MTKSFRLEADGLVKEPGGNLVQGLYHYVDVAGAEQLAELIAGLELNQALCFGVAAVHAAPIAARSVVRDGEITRTGEHFDWPMGPGWLLVDYDAPEGERPLTREELWSRLVDAWPALAEAPAVIGSSASAYIYNSETGEELVGPGGLRVYIQIADARDIPRAGRTLHERLWLAGHGYFNLSKAGHYLDRSLVDTAVWQPERLDFAAGAHCEPPLKQHRPEPEVRNPMATPIDTRQTLPDLNTEDRERLESLRAELRSALREEQTQIREAWLEERLQAVAEGGDDPQARDQLLRVLDRGELPAVFRLFSHSLQDWVEVRELLADRDRWDGERFADPLEPEYRGDTRIAWANLQSGTTPYLYSHAHGGQRFDLIGDLPSIQVRLGEMPELIRKADRILADAGSVYQRGGELVRILNREGHIQAVTPPWLKTHLEERARWLKCDRRGHEWRVSDCPGELPSRILHNRGAWGVPELTGVVRGPILRADGSLLKQPGYDRHTGILLLADHPDGWPCIPEEPSAEQIRQALTRLWEPFEHFPFVDALSRSILLAALLTAVQRPMLETAPAFGLNAYKAGSGKSKAAKAIAWLGGEEPVESPWSTEAEEQRKRLMSSLMEGPSAILLDNISGRMDSDTLCAILTSSRFKDRRLGTSDEVSAPTRVLVLATGNNLQLVGDLARRVLISTIDHGVESPERLAFPFDPVQRVRERWLYYRAAALTVLRGFIAAGQPGKGEGVVGSYEQWDALIRQCVLWLRDQELAPFELADPADAVTQNYDADPETQKLEALLELWYACHPT
ncbi:hypothetical protein [Halorhodospira halophila]|uniref:hypothetical protein n=1 Tax=Halorhodospira halophila TaxID=1053 RepID=UPI0019124980|nr:hypothetical protein [Halorhodospira halophila]MBK5936159.1 hypothetical protein [Halorhodospira halophila]